MVGVSREFYRALPFALTVPEKKVATLIANYCKEGAGPGIITKSRHRPQGTLQSPSGGIRFVDGVPRTGPGKLLRPVVRENPERLFDRGARRTISARPNAAAVFYDAFSSCQSGIHPKLHAFFWLYFVVYTMGSAWILLINM